VTKNDHVCGTPDAMCDTECMENAYRPLLRYMVMQLRFDRESFDALKQLLLVHSMMNIGRASKEESSASRHNREALKRVFDQIRDTTYSDV
jgi:hypothetical protein